MRQAVEGWRFRAACIPELLDTSNLLRPCHIIRKCSLKVITFSHTGHVDRLTQLTNGVGMDMHFYPMHSHFEQTEIQGVSGDSKSICLKTFFNGYLFPREIDRS